MSIPALALVIIGCVVYLGIGYGAAMFFTMNGPNNRFKKVGLRLFLLFFWLPFLIVSPIISVIASIFV